MGFLSGIAYLFLPIFDLFIRATSVNKDGGVSWEVLLGERKREMFQQISTGKEVMEGGVEVLCNEGVMTKTIGEWRSQPC